MTSDERTPCHTRESPLKRSLPLPFFRPHILSKIQFHSQICPQVAPAYIVWLEQLSKNGAEKVANIVPKLASMSGKDQDSLVPVSRITAELTLPSRSVRRTRQRPAKDIIISLWLMILLANPDSTTPDGILNDSLLRT